MFDQIDILLAKTHEGLMSWVPPYLGEMREVLDLWFKQSGLPEIALPLGVCKAAGGDPGASQVLKASAAMLAGLVGIQILDDIRLRQDPEALWMKIGVERSSHFAHAFQTLSSRLWGKILQENDDALLLKETFEEGTFITLAGRDKDLSYLSESWDDYWKNAEMGSAYLPAQMATVGAMLAGVKDEKVIEACHGFGFHVGLTRHILNELINLKVDLRHTGRGKIDLPVLYALKSEHPFKAELLKIVREGQLTLHQKRIREILEAVEAEKYLKWAALQERKRAMEALQLCPSEEGKKFLKAFLQEWFDRIPSFGSLDPKEMPIENQLKRTNSAFDPNEVRSGLVSLSYKSVGLGLRKQIRQTPLYHKF